MRGTSSYFSRGTARALLVSAAMLAGATLSPAHAASVADPVTNTGHDTPGSDETAFAPAPGASNGAHLPHPLKPALASRLRAIFLAQRAADFTAADRLAEGLSDETLRGDILADRYLNPAYRPNAAQLRQWLHLYASYPDASQIQSRLIAISPRGSVAAASFPQSLSAATVDDQTQTARDPLSRLILRNPLLDRTIAERTSWGVHGAQSALHLVDTTPGMTPLYTAQLKTEIALAMLSSGEDTLALNIASAAFEHCDQLGFAGFIAGLSAWHRGNFSQAGAMFERASRATVSESEVRAASRFWAARARAQAHDHRGWETWMSRAAASPGTFYGILAGRALETARRPKNAAPTPDALAAAEPIPVLTDIDVEAVAATPQGTRLFALLQIGETAKAEAVLRRMWPDIAADAAMGRSIQLVAQTAGLHDLAEQIATLLAARDGDLAHVAGFPVPHLAPRHGFRMDPALVYAMTRLESNFNPQASSGAGAHGLMQIMPVTAAFVTQKRGAPVQVTQGLVDQLRMPGPNLEVGQLYMLYLAGLSQGAHSGAVLPPSGGDMVRMLASYNAGPGAIGRWASLQEQVSDPLMFIETLPNPETRNYVHRAFTYLWIYADKLELPAPSLAALAQSHWPSFGEETALAGRRPTLH